MKVILYPLCALLLAVFLSGCSASNQAGPGADGEVALHSNNSLLANRLAVEALQEKKVGDLLFVQATLENGWKFELDFQYKIKWFDKDGFEVAPESQPWRQLVMAGRSQSNVQAVAPNPSAVRYEIWVRE
ncbi:YcfL family protein [Alloalcanivorax sp. C16-2]|uniref:YcfL family protein n=1 Tax=Alloalcanivorax TaxID=3020832 RepID=UPI00193133C4|nr:YcfL family protein [Alloalcanivorax marinus]MBL7251131.1 YcfL family protein [Alloalcanivorax marinus]